MSGFILPSVWHRGTEAQRQKDKRASKRCFREPKNKNIKKRWKSMKKQLQGSRDPAHKSCCNSCPQVGVLLLRTISETTRMSLGRKKLLPSSNLQLLKSVVNSSFLGLLRFGHLQGKWNTLRSVHWKPWSRDRHSHFPRYLLNYIPLGIVCPVQFFLCLRCVCTCPEALSRFRPTHAIPPV